ncbi:hypothetical protein AURDEDRAFT_188033 [Auricularia subglabra TFB-10046 SS5]|uniref:FAD linked oxidase N-terminal domain-containing protein n=1 Tax=Auricularia subglabra (strain TFB-10046 / SS5) TaxID=717982 RepID=J0WUP7_AURST|nr:hypothetical protein AURDEDRAFT_188033 [Auricularia subglabra TFB-10046 SS5]
MRFQVLMLLALSAGAVASLDYLPVCREIARAVSNVSAVFYPGSGFFEADVWHWAISSYELSTCSVEPGSAADVGVVPQILGTHRTPFAVKGGGHASNPGFSSTKGVHISMTRFDTVTYDAAAQTARLGQGSFGTTSYGLVTPDGNERTVTASDEDLFWALKGGGNNFGIVTHFTLNTYPQTDGGTLLYGPDQLDAVQDAFATFTTFNDPKAQIITTINSVIGVPGVAQLLFDDAPTPPPGIFDAFLETPSLINTGKSVLIFDTVTVRQFTPDLVKAILNESEYLGTRLPLETEYLLSYDVEPFAANYLLNPNRTSPTSAFPPVRSEGVPLNLYFAWILPSFDSKMQQAARDSVKRIQQLELALGPGETALPRYPNYAIYDTPLEDMFGHEGQMRVLTVTLSLLIAFVSVVAANAPQSTASACTPSCPLGDKNDSALGSSDSNDSAGTITCYYPMSSAAPKEFSCTYSSANGQLTADDDEGLCPSSAATSCTSRRKRSSENRVQNIVRKYSNMRAAAVHGDVGIAPTREIPDFVKSRARLSRRIRAYAPPIIVAVMHA